MASLPHRTDRSYVITGLLVSLVLILGRCDSLSMSLENDHTTRMAMAQAWYAEVLALAPTGTQDLASLVRHRSPDWSTARVFRHPDGHPVVAARLSGTHLRPSSDTLVSAGWIVVELERESTVEAGMILEFLVPGPVLPADLMRYLPRYWRADFRDRPVTVMEFSVHYEARRGYVFEPGAPPREARIEVHTPQAGKRLGVAASCWFGRTGHYDAETGELLYCDNYRLIYCEPEEEEDGGGGGEADCDCDNRPQCDLEKEYSDHGVNGSWPCHTFTLVEGGYYVGTAGIENNKHEGYGVLQSSLPSGLANLKAYFETDLAISSAYRCPVGNRAAGSQSDNSHHVHGGAADFKPLDLPWNEATKEAIGDWAEGPGGAAEYRSDYANHLHIAWN